MEFSDEQKVWAGLLAYSGDPILANQLLPRYQSGARAFAAGVASIDQNRSEEPSIIDFSDLTGDIPAINDAIWFLAELAPTARADLLSSVLFGTPFPEHAPEDRFELQARLKPLLESRPGAGSTDRALSTTALGAAIGLASLGLVIWLTTTSPGSDQVAGQAVPTIPLPTTVAETEIIDLLDLVADAERVLDIALEADGTVVRRDPLSADLLWRSRPYLDAREIRVDADVVTVVRSSGWTTYLHLVDGTQLPP